MCAIIVTTRESRNTRGTPRSGSASATVRKNTELDSAAVRERGEGVAADADGERDRPAVRGGDAGVAETEGGDELAGQGRGRGLDRERQGGRGDQGGREDEFQQGGPRTLDTLSNRAAFVAKFPTNTAPRPR
jgi:hypothetical protein